MGFSQKTRLVFSVRRDRSVINRVNDAIYDLPSPKKISYWWGFGSLLILFLGVQIITGLFLAVHYVSDLKISFQSVDSITREVGFGWIVRAIHAKGASAYFLFLYLHIGRGVYYGSYLYNHAWNTGVLILFLSMAAAFLGYVLPWGQMSYWGATVITKFFSTVPYVGKDLVQWIWGGFAVGYPTLTRFFAIHFLVPFAILGLVLIHIIFLHDTGSNNPLGLATDGDKIPFHPYFITKDLVGYSLVVLLFIRVVIYSPDFFTDPENYIEAKVLVTPVHIQPEWYFLPAYAILRSIPNKLGGVIALVLRVAILFILPLIFTNNQRGNSYSLLHQSLFWIWLSSILILLWIGSRAVEDPYVFIGQIGTIIYFRYYLILPLLRWFLNLNLVENE